MIPPLIVRRALELDLGMIAVTDHNTTDNVMAVRDAAAGTGLRVLPGMEVQTREDAHIVCLFETVAQVVSWEEIVYAHLPDVSNDAEALGAQFVVDETGDFVRMNERLLLTATSLSTEDVVELVGSLGGLTIAAHVDRQAFSILASLGFLPPGLRLDAVEISRHAAPQDVLRQHPSVAGLPMVTSGDAHRLSEMRAATLVTVRAPTLEELALALQGVGGRSIEILSRDQ